MTQEWQKSQRAAETAGATGQDTQALVAENARLSDTVKQLTATVDTLNGTIASLEKPSLDTAEVAKGAAENPS